MTRDAFVAFVKELGRSLRDDPPAWENTELGAFLDALAAWVEDMDGFYRNQGVPVPSVEWTVFSHALAAARVYE